MQNLRNKKDYSVIILAAGKSERLGFPKLSLKFNKEQSFIENIANEYNDYGCNEIIVIVNEAGQNYIADNYLKFPLNTKIVLNEHPDWHRFYSLKIGANLTKENNSVFVHNVDNPFVNQEVLDELLNNSDKADYINPEYNGKGGHPFLISNKIIRDLKVSESDQMHLKEFLNQYTRLRVSVTDKNILVNINLLKEYILYFKE